MRKRVLSILLAACMLGTTGIGMTQPVLVSAQSEYVAKSGITIKEEQHNEKLAIKGEIAAGKKQFVVNFSVKEEAELNILPMISYNKSASDTDYTALIQDQLTSVSVYRENGTKVSGYTEVTKADVFTEKEFKQSSTIKVPDLTDQDTTLYRWGQFLKAGKYRIVYTLPGEVTKGARVHLNYGIYDYIDTENDYIKAKNTQKKTAQVITAGKYLDRIDVAVVSKTAKKELWYKIISGGKRNLDISVDEICNYETDSDSKKLKFEFYDSNNKWIKTKIWSSKNNSIFDDIEDLFEVEEEDDDTYGCQIHNVESGDLETTVNRGITYLKVTPVTKWNGYFMLDLDGALDKAATPKVTYWAFDKGIIKGMAEAGSRAYAVINKKTYQAAQKTDSKGNYSIKIPKVKEGTKIKVYIKDIYGVNGKSSRTVTMQGKPKTPRLTSYKRDTTKIKGISYPNSKVYVTYAGTIYRTVTNEEGDFIVTVSSKLRVNTKIKVKVQRNSGSMSDEKVYVIQ